MAQLQDKEKFSQRLDRTITEQGIIQTTLARASSLQDSQVSAMRKGDDYTRITKTPVRKCIEGLIRLHTITTVDEIKVWIRTYYIERQANGLPIKKLSRQEWVELVQLLKQVQAEQTESLEKPKYTTIDGTSLIERDQDILNVLNILRDKNARLLFLVGPPGIGKTELSRQVGLLEAERRYFTYVRTYSLAPGITSPDAVITLLIDNLKGIPTRVRTLVILHNCEQVKGLRRVLHDFLDANKHVTILATSRRQMTENDYPVQTLKVPKRIDEPPGTLHQYGAIRLFLATANRNIEEDKALQITEDNAKTIASICIALDGIPLMLRLAASMVRKLQGVEGVYSWLRNGKLQGVENPIISDEEWHVSINTVLERSYQLLESKEQALFRRLAVFTGKCSIEAAMNICNLDDDLSKEKGSFTTIVIALSNYFLITFENERIEIAHNTMRDFALRNLREIKQKWAEGEEEKIIRIQHRDFFLATAKDFFPDFLEFNPLFSRKPKVLERSRLGNNSDPQRAKMVFLRFEQMVNNWLEGYEPEFVKQMKEGTYLSVIKSPEMEAALTDHQNFYDAMAWTFQNEGADGWQAFGYLEHIWHMPDHYADLCLQWMGLWVLEFGTTASYTGVEDRCRT